MNKVLKAEKKIRKKETQQSLPPHSEKSYQKALLTSPNSSYLWIKYAAFALDQFGVERARSVFEQACKQVSQVELREKLNVYLAWMNLESHFGDENSFEQATAKALTVNENSPVLRHKALKFLQKGKLEDCEEILRYRCRKDSKNLKTWEDLLKFYLQSLKDEEKFDECYKKALQSLKDSLDLKKITAGLYYENGEYEKGKTIMENLINEKPKRSDFWIFFIQREEKAGNLEMVRDLYERVLYKKLSPSSFRQISKSYHEFELKHGHPEKANEISNRFNITLE
jgi:rRNA biogenesis protein RRP5